MITLENTRTLYDLVQNAGKEYGDKVCLRSAKDDVIYERTYRELMQDSAAIAAWVEEQNRRSCHKTHAALLGRCSYEYLTALFGITGAGSVAVPLDNQLQKETMIDNITRSDVEILFYDWEFHSQVEVIMEECPNIREKVCIQQVRNDLSTAAIYKEYCGVSFQSDAAPEDCAIIIFTSGTTGLGKGVMLSHGNLIDNTFCTTEKTDQSREVCLNLLPIHHVFCLNGDILLVIRYGSTLALCPELSKMLHYIKLFEPSVIRVVPMMAKMLYNKIAITQKQNPDISAKEAKDAVLGTRLHRIISGGGYLAPELAMDFASLGIEIAQGYGMSECSPKISSPVYERQDKLASVGKIVDRCQVRIADGEIQVKSPSVMMGYYKDKERTAEAFTEDGWLCTGDLGYVDDENFLYLTGRKKNLIIMSNGENISPEGIENKFDGDILISDILVYGEDDVIAAEIYPNYEYAQASKITDIEAAVQKVVNERNGELPPYARIVRCTVRKHPFEKNSSNKIIRQKYFDSKKKADQKSKRVKKPTSDLQQQIYDILTEIIGNDLFGVNSNLYQNGLDSFGSILFIEEIHNRLQLNITLNDLLEQNTVEKLEMFLQTKKDAAPVDYSVREVYPLTNMQKYFVYIIRGNTTGNLPFTFKLDNSIDLERLRTAILDTIDAHPGLRGIIRSDGRQCMLYRDDSREIDVPIINLTDAEWKDRIQELLVPFAYTADDNLFHIYLFQTETSKYMLFDVSHAMGDGISMNILLEDVNKRYQGEEIEKETYTFYEYALEEQMREENGIRAKDISYISRLLKGSRLNRSILTKKDARDNFDETNAVIRKRFDMLVRKKILYFCKQNGVSENVLFLTAFNYCISLFSDENDLFSNSIHSGRTDSRFTRLAGPLFLTYFCRFTRLPHERVIDLLKKTGKQIMNTMKCSISTPRQGDMFFQYQGDIINISEIGGAPAEKVHLQLDSLPFHMQVMNDNDGYFMELRYWESRFDKDQLAVFLCCYEHIVNAILKERSVRRLKRHMPDEIYPKHYFVSVSDVNREAGYDFLEPDDEKKVKVYILDEGFRKKPFGAWGPLYVMDEEPIHYTETIQNPYSPGTLYRTEQIARILPDGRLDFLENSGRTVVTDGVHGRRFYDLAKLEETLYSCEGVKAADAYLRYDNQTNEMSLIAEIRAGSEIKTEDLKEYIKENCSELLVPKEIKKRR